MVERLIAMYTRKRTDGESAPAFFQRVDLAGVTASCAICSSSPRPSQPLDFVDLAETAEFAPEVMEGECSA